MGNHNFKPKENFSKNQPVEIVGSKFSEDQVPKEMKTFGRAGYAIHTTQLSKSRSGAQPVYVTRVKFPKSNKYETFLSNDLKSINR
jgi:hypothetical protein